VRPNRKRKTKEKKRERKEKANEGRELQNASAHCYICINTVAKYEEARATHGLYLTEFTVGTASTGLVRVEWHLKGF
jgi:hypothetical protein